MNAKFTNQHSFFFLFLSLLAFSSPAFAGAWTQEEGRSLLIVTGRYYATDSLYNNQGRKQTQPDYSKYELNPYFEYGLWDGVTLGSNLMLQYAKQDGTPEQTNWGIGDSEFFARLRLMKIGGFVVSAEPMVKLPSPERSYETPQLGGRHADAGMGLSVGYGFELFSLNHFVNLDTQYRHRFGSPKDQVNAAATLGVKFSDDFMVLSQAFVTKRVETPSVVSFTQSSGDDYDLTKLQLSGVYKFSNDIALQVGGFAHIDGKNTGAGNGGLLSVWKKF